MLIDWVDDGSKPRRKVRRPSQTGKQTSHSAAAFRHEWTDMCADATFYVLGNECFAFSIRQKRDETEKLTFTHWLVLWVER
jgi:hypothetical protein